MGSPDPRSTALSPVRGFFSLSPNKVATAACWTSALLLVAWTAWQRITFSPTAIVVLILLLSAGVFWWDVRRDAEIRQVSPPGLISPLLFALSGFVIVELLFQAWQTGLITTFSIGGLLPYSDADEFVNGAKSLITFGELGQWSARRPLGTNLIAVILWFTDQDYQRSLIALALITGVATFIAARQTFLSGGLFAAVIYVGFTALAAFDSSVQFMSERAGFIFALMSYAVLLSAFRNRSFWQSLAGIGLLVIAQAARPGALFAIPLICVYAVYFFWTNAKEAVWKALGIIAICSALGLVSPLLSLKMGPPEATYEGAIPYTLYGMAAGGKPWDYVLNEHPEIFQMPSDEQRSEYIYRLFREKISTQPGVFARAIGQKFWHALSHPASVYFGPVYVFSWLVTTCALIGLIVLFSPMIRRRGAHSFLPAVAIGVILSAPFLFDTGHRGYMSIIPFEIGLAAVPFSRLVEWIRGRSQKTEPTEDRRRVFPAMEAAFSITLFAAITLIPIWIAAAANPNKVSSAVQKAGTYSDEGVFYFNPHSGVFVEGDIPDRDALNVRLTSITGLSGFARELDAHSHIFRNDYLCDALLLIHPVNHQEIVVSYVLFDRVPDLRPGYLIASLRLIAQEGHVGLFKAGTYRRLDL